ncbi:MAG: hypothetical protein MJE63_05005 [Proteobacteria bacterium]|nr:hypothetical protein [Pseudomonadota bacterium]
MEISSYSIVVRMIAYFKRATQLIKEFNHKEGEFDGQYYGMHHAKNTGYYQKHKQSFLLDFSIYNPKEYKVFALYFLRNLVNFLISITYFPIYTHYYSIKSLINQYKYLSKEMKSVDVLDIARKLEFHGVPHLIFISMLAPIGFFLNFFFVEPLERFFYSFICVTVLQVIFLLKLVPYVVILMISPFAIFIGLTWLVIHLIYKFLVNAHKVVFKKIKVS